MNKGLLIWAIILGGSWGACMSLLFLHEGLLNLIFIGIGLGLFSIGLPTLILKLIFIFADWTK